MATIIAIVTVVAGLFASFFVGLGYERKRMLGQALEQENAMRVKIGAKRREVKKNVEKILNELPASQRNDAIDKYSSDVLRRWNDFKRQIDNT